MIHTDVSTLLWRIRIRERSGIPGWLPLSGNDPAGLTDYTRAGRACNIEVSDVKIVPSVSELGSKSSAKQNPDIQDSDSNAREGETIMISVRTSRSRSGNVSGWTPKPLPQLCSQVHAHYTHQCAQCEATRLTSSTIQGRANTWRQVARRSWLDSGESIILQPNQQQQASPK